MKKPLKIAILSYRSAPFGGGQGIYVYELSKALYSIGHNVDVISGPPYPELIADIKLIKLPGLNLFSTFKFRERLKIFFHTKNKSVDDWYEFSSTLMGGFPELQTFGNRAKMFLSDKNYDAVIDNQSISFGMIDIQKSKPFIEIMHHPISKDYFYDLKFARGLVQRLSKMRWFSFLKMQKKVAKQIKVVVTPSLNSKQDIHHDFKVPMQNIQVIPNGIDFNIFCALPNIVPRVNGVITTASADVPLKGLDFSLHAIARLKYEYPDINLTVIGSPRAEGHTERLIKRLKLEEQVSFKTNLTKEEITHEYAKSSVAVVSSLYEGFGFPVGEAMACAIPLVATNVASIPEITGSFAQLIPAEDEEEIYQGIKNIFQNPQKYKIQAEFGRQHIIENFNWTKIGYAYEELLYKTINDFKC
ncbi:glycosyltransferase family 4 protein [Gammaproteobacteria bacterium]|nr:glycosyltransferase family 4 protein [Gammaproteobacteria bacterium]MDB3877966.1 glycosyltransferase family 4 protein [Gammaproteobacteria bacterium]MDB4242740.1 glycosyltransferase family 4 protein [Gammaproteobacteria bacterium]MDC0090118.1 glycosyltransferase family 4 protein [Gammaproteobacteria bacterium]